MRGNFYQGENLEGVTQAPINIIDNSKLIYSPHVYGPSVSAQSYFSDPNFPNNMPAIWDTHFGYVKGLTGRAIVVGEWGGHYTSSDLTWQNAFASYISTNLNGFFYWCVNPNSGDTGGLLLGIYFHYFNIFF